MKPRAFGFGIMIVSVVVCLAFPALGQNVVTVSMPANATGTGTWNSPQGGVYTGIYTGTVTGLPGANPGIICDDYYDTVYPPQTWSATALNVSTLNPTNIGQALFGGGYTGQGYANIGLQGYAEVATLVSYMYSGHSGYTPTELSTAIWYLTSGGFGLGSNGLSLLDSAAKALVGQLQSTVGSSLSTAEAALAGFTNLYILTPYPAGQTGQPQEMFVSVPEGGAAIMYLLLAGLCCWGAIFFKSKREWFTRDSGRPAL